VTGDEGAVPVVEDEQPVRLVVLGDPAGAPVCEGDVCSLPPASDSTMDTDSDGSPPVPAQS
jgi:hypothetical protein